MPVQWGIIVLATQLNFMAEQWLIERAKLATPQDDGTLRGDNEETCVVVSDGSITHIGEAPEGAFEQRLDAGGQWLTPGLIDCHTHLVFGGNRADEFAWRLQGQSYADIAAKGGGIMSSVRQTRSTDPAALFDQSAARLARLLDEGVTTVEIKSGYGLDLDTELKMLRVARELEARHPITVKTTFLGAHAVPAERKEQGTQAYLNHVITEMLPAVAESGLADAVDVFCEHIAFSPEQCAQLYEAAHKHGLPIKAHAEQLSNLHGAVTAAKHQALSVDHLEYLSPDDVPALRDTVAVLLPAAFYYLRETQLPPIDSLREHGIAMAVASDLNPGTAPMASLLTAMNMACVLFRLTPAEALAGVTQHAARALGLGNKGRINVGMDADLLLWDIGHPNELSYGINTHRPKHIWQHGRKVR